MRKVLRRAGELALDGLTLLETMPARRREARRLRDIGPVPGLRVATFHLARDAGPGIAAALKGLRSGLYASGPCDGNEGVFILTATGGTLGHVGRLPLIAIGSTLHPDIGGTDADPIAMAVAVLSSPMMEQGPSERLVGMLDALAALEADARPDAHPDAGSFRITAPTPWLPSIAGQSADPPQRTEAWQNAPTSPPLLPTAPIVDPAAIGMPVCANLSIRRSGERVEMIRIGPLHGTWRINPFAPGDRPGLDAMAALRIIDDMRRRLEA
jgi:hypothetical protein